MALDPVLYRTPMFDDRGNMSREWVRFFDQLSVKLESVDTSWTTWTPTITGWAPMTASSIIIHDAHYRQIGDCVLFKLYAELTLGGTASNQIFVNLPFPVAGTPFFTASTFSTVIRQAGGFYAPGWGYCEPAGSLAKILLAGEGNFALGATAFLIEGFYRAST